VYPGAGTPIQDAVDGAGEGDTIYVHAGTYIENVNVDKRLTLIGEGADVVTVRAADARSDHVFEMTANWVNMSGFTVTGATYRSGVYLDSVDYCNISDNNASNNWYGIALNYSSSNTLLNNNVSNNKFGIAPDYSTDNTLQSNTVSNNDDGIYMWYSSNNTLTNNIFINDGFFIDEGSYKNNVENNTVNGKPLAYLEDASNFIIQSAGQVILVNCTNITVENLNISNAGVGVELWETDDCKIASNNVSSNTFGILLGYSSNNILKDNIASNKLGGIYLYYSSGNALTTNTASNNEVGIYLYSSSNNTLSHNNLIDNTDHNAYDDSGTNTWDSGSEGNYYSDYNGTDPDGDGIGEIPYDIPGGESVDHFPLMRPWSAPPQKGDLNSDGTLTPADAAIAL